MDIVPAIAIALLIIAVGVLALKNAASWTDKERQAVITAAYGVAKTVAAALPNGITPDELKGILNSLLSLIAAMRGTTLDEVQKEFPTVDKPAAEPTNPAEGEKKTWHLSAADKNHIFALVPQETAATFATLIEKYEAEGVERYALTCDERWWIIERGEVVQMGAGGDVNDRILEEIKNDEDFEPKKAEGTNVPYFIAIGGAGTIDRYQTKYLDEFKIADELRLKQIDTIEAVVMSPTDAAYKATVTNIRGEKLQLVCRPSATIPTEFSGNLERHPFSWSTDQDNNGLSIGEYNLHFKLTSIDGLTLYDERTVKAYVRSQAED